MRLTKKWVIAASVAVGAAALSGGGIAAGAALSGGGSVPGPDGVIHACYLASSPTIKPLYLVATPPACPSRYTAIAFNQTGPQGPQGIQGIQGVQGPTGATGATGAT